ncbi:hypothetical protein [Streptomyces flavofungini]|uniref:hypothetical protein n=1 Tax=Streptomyces flavofungini TaxID=68200 RepID=UPI0025B1C9DB|nr:hypothetical protein [Streptomyces flavofungini]WJV50585.1 hypothetical protein QUY26_36850 [Streptomyces flavofungini]
MAATLSSVVLGAVVNVATSFIELPDAAAWWVVAGVLLVIAVVLLDACRARVEETVRAWRSTSGKGSVRSRSQPPGCDGAVRGHPRAGDG